MKKTLLCTATLATALLAAACGSDTTTPADAVVVSEAWVKASDTGTTGAFAELRNAGSSDVHVVGVTSPSSTATELHEMVSADGTSMVMKEMGDGLVIPRTPLTSSLPVATTSCSWTSSNPCDPGAR